MKPGHKPAPRENFTWGRQESQTTNKLPLPVSFWSEKQLANIPSAPPTPPEDPSPAIK